MISLKSYGLRTDQGPYLQINEDAVEVDLNNHLYMIFDGFGGSSIGDKAVHFLKEKIKIFYTKVSGDPEATLPFFYSPKYLIEGNALVNAMELAHRDIKRENKEKDMNTRGGASAIAVAQSENLLTVCHTGNCIAYYYGHGTMKTLCVPDNYEFIAGDVGDREFATAPTSGFGLFDDLHLQVKEVRVKKGDRMILLTDGVYARMSESEIMDILRNDQMGISEKIDTLFETANSRGNWDNQTALILNF